MKRFLLAYAATVVASLAFPASLLGQMTVFRDDFTVFHDYHTGTVPVGGIWTGVANADNGDNAGLAAKFVANGIDDFGVERPGVLLIGDMNGQLPEDDVPGVGFEGGRNTAPFLYKEVPSEQDWQATVKINAQTAGNWSNSGIVARRAGPPIGVSPLDPTESFITVGSFRTDGANPGNATLLMQNIVNAVETEANPAFIPGTPAPTAPLPVYVRMLKQGSSFTSQASFDGTTWVTRSNFTNAPLAAGGGTIQIGPSFMMFGAGGGETEIDFFELSVGLPTIISSTWTPVGGGNWGTFNNWTSLPVPGVPDNNQVEVTFGPSITANATVFTDADRTARRIVFNNAFKYAVAGTGTLRLESEASMGNAQIAVQQGSHEIQTAVTLGASNLDINAGEGTRLDFNNRLSLNGRSVNITGTGVVSINNTLPSVAAAAGGTITNRATLQGTGRINGALINALGTVAPGNNGVGTLATTGNYGQVANSTLSIELGGASPGQYDKLVVGGTMSISGILNVQLINGFTPSAGNAFDILDFTAASGAGFATINLPTLSPGLTWNTSSLMTTGVLSISGGPTIDADFNDDNRVDGQDFLIWQRNLRSTGGTNALGDTDNNGTVDATDLANWRSRFGAQPGASAAPEPASWTLIAMALGGWALRRRR